MDKIMDAVFELGNSVMLAVQNGKIIRANSRAEELFGANIVGSSPVGIIPEHIFADTSDNFVSTALINGKAYCAHAVKEENILLLSFDRERSRGVSSELLSDSLLADMLSTVFNIGMAIDRVSAETSDESSEKLSDYLAILNHSYFKMRHTLSNLSTAVGLKNDSIPYSFRAVDLAQLCSNLVSTVSLICRKKGLSIDFSTKHGELYAYADSEKLERILLNLLSNSIAHTPSGGSIVVGLEKSGDTAYISVDDNGCGIPAAEMADLFSAYDRETVFDRLPTGGGLGLGVARGFAEAHGGALIVESREGKGTSVRVMLPLRSASLSVLESPSVEFASHGMSLILTELASVLDSDSYTEKYLD